MITAVRLSGRRWTPIALVIVGLAVGTIGVNIARIGFEIMRPVSVIEDEIAKDRPRRSRCPTRSRGGCSTPGGVLGGSFARFLSLVPVLLLVAVDPRRRPMSATLVYAAGLFALWAFTIGRTPAFQPMMPGPVPTVVALVITIAIAVVGGLAARWLAETLATADRLLWTVRARVPRVVSANFRAAQAHDGPADRAEEPFRPLGRASIPGRRAPGRRITGSRAIAAPIQNDLDRRVALESPSEEVVEVLPIR